MSFSRELLNEPRRDTSKQAMDNTTKTNEVNTSEPGKPCDNVFHSFDFGKFLSKELPKNSDGGANPFLSKDFSLPPVDDSIFKSKDSFSKLFSSSDWKMKFTPLSEPTQSVPKTPPSEQVVAPAAAPSAEKLRAKHFSSKDWMPMNTLGNHIDVSYSSDIFTGSDDEISKQDPAHELPPAKTDWDNLLFPQLQLMPPATPPPPEPEDYASHATEDPVTEAVAFPMEAEPFAAPVAVTPEVPSSAPSIPKRIRKRKPRKKVVPDVKVYVEPRDTDVLLGRGGRSNHHPGNKRYREEVKNLQGWYMRIEDKDEKTDLSQLLVDYVHNYDGRFLEKDATGWYIVPNIVARRKASQALREDNDPQKRAAKRARHLTKKAEEAKKQMLMEAV